MTSAEMTYAEKRIHPELTTSLLWVMAIATGLIVANLYYNQLLCLMIWPGHIM